MLVPIDLQTGEEAIAILPGIHKQFGIDHVKAVKGIVTDIKQINNDRSMTIKYQDFGVSNPFGGMGTYNSTPQWKVIKILEYRIIKFTFGGVWQKNVHFDLPRIEKEEKCKLDPSFIDWF